MITLVSLVLLFGGVSFLGVACVGFFVSLGKKKP